MRSRTPTNPVGEYIESLAPDKQELAKEVRRIVSASAAHLEGTVREGRACYFFYGPVCFFAPSRGGIRLFPGQGA